MPLAADKICSYPKKLRKSMKKVMRDPFPEEVHKLRTRSRRFQSMLKALSLDSRKNEDAVLAAVKPIRRKAGRVRDMDVLTDFASRPQLQGEEECSVRLLEHLGSTRARDAAKLQERAKAQYSQIRKGLKKCAQFLQKQLSPGKQGGSARPADKLASEAAAVALQLETELRDWPNLTRANLHQFRLEVKKLRYVLQMAENSDSEFVSALGDVKDGIGEWHDWEELSAIAKQVIQHPGCRLVREIRRIASEKFEHALTSGNQMRQDFLNSGAARKKSRVSSKKPSRAAIESVSSIAA
jgi:CHAD domain-containing protein